MSEFIARCPTCGTTYDGREDAVEGIQGWHPGLMRWQVDCAICGAPNLEIDHQATEEEEFGCEDDN